jgi:hypothetical protein
MWYEFLLKLMIVSVSCLFAIGCFAGYRYVMDDDFEDIKYRYKSKRGESK